MANPKINISSLDFDSIKTSLKTYLSGLKNADGTLTFEGYDFDGAGINVLLDILSYNTLYYSFYSNMIGNETFLDTAQIENNIVSLVKPLGYLVTGKSASKTEMTVKSVSAANTLTAYTDFFTALSTSGASYKFYPIQNYSLSSGTAADIVLYEGRTVANNLPVVVDITDQKAFLGNTNIDLNTLTVKVNGTAWAQYSAFQANPGPDSEVYFLDRTSSGFYVIFGKKTLNDYQSTFGKKITENDIVTVSYMVPSGTVANNITSIKNSKVTVSSTSKSAGGTDGVDLNLVKFFAPKMFAANDRAVTKDDYYGLLFSSNILPSNITQSEQVNVWGGEEADPPAFGRVFISYADTTLTANTASVKKSIAFLKNKSVVTVLPEYVQPQTITASITLSVDGLKGPDQSGMQQLVEDYYNTTLIFNNSVILTDIKNLIIDAYPYIKRVDASAASLSLTIKGSGSDKAIYFKNQLNTPSTTTAGTVIFTDPFTYKGTTIRLVDSKKNSTEGVLLAQNYTTKAIINSYGNLGYVNYSTGAVFINSDVLDSTQTIDIIAVLKYPNSITIKNEFLVSVSATIIST